MQKGPSPFSPYPRSPGIGPNSTGSLANPRLYGASPKVPIVLETLYADDTVEVAAEKMLPIKVELNVVYASTAEIAILH